MVFDGQDAVALDDVPNSKRVLERLRGEAKTKQRRDSLGRLEATCDALDRSGGDLTFANIGRRCYEEFKKGPLDSSIKNDSGFTEYVQARREERAIAVEPGKVGRRKVKTPLASQIERIPDQVLRSRIRSLYGESVELRKKLLDVKAALLLIAPGLEMDTLIRRYRANPGAPVSAAPPRNSLIQPEDQEGLRLLLRAFDQPELLSRFGLENDGKRIRRAKGVRDELVPTKVLQALRRLDRVLTDNPGTVAADVEGEVMDAS